MPVLTRWALPVAALAMPLVAWLTQSGLFGGDVGAESRRFPSLLVPAGYAFAIWGLIFLLDVVFAAGQARPRRDDEHALDRLRPWAIAGFVLTAAWMPVFTRQAHVGAVLVIWSALACMLTAAVLAARAPGTGARPGVMRMALALHAGWLSLAAFVNTAQLGLALGLTTATTQWPSSVALWVGAAVLLLAVQRALAAAAIALLAYSAAALWGLVGVVLEQNASTLPGAQMSAWVAVALIAVLCVHAAWLLGGPFAGRAAPAPGAPANQSVRR